MKTIVYSFLFLAVSGLTACGLKYVPPVTQNSQAINRQKAVSDYIRASYKDSSIVYRSILFGAPTTVKPYIYEQLDSLFEVKYQNELRGKFDTRLEEQIANQKIVIQSSSQKIKAIEHHVYAMQTPETTHAYFSDVIFDDKGKIESYNTSISYNFPTNQLSLFNSYMISESFIQSGYEMTKGERDVVDLLNKRLDSKNGEEANDYMKQMLNIFNIIKTTKQVETKSILRHLATINSEGRLFNTATDKFLNAEALYQGDNLFGYEVQIETPNGRKTLQYSPAFELMK